jgi:hypothetical protein
LSAMDVDANAACASDLEGINNSISCWSIRFCSCCTLAWFSDWSFSSCREESLSNWIKTRFKHRETGCSIGHFGDWPII